MRSRKQLELFVDTINLCGFQDVGFVGPKFTCLYQCVDEIQILERLDRALATHDWLDLFSIAKLYHLSSSASNCSPLSLHLVHRQKKRKTRRPLGLNPCG